MFHWDNGMLRLIVGYGSRKGKYDRNRMLCLLDMSSKLIS